MANYSNLKAAIAAAIKQNGNQEITGQVLQNVLTSMVSVIGANYTFAGVATPSTNPGTPDQNVVYMASQAGMYTNFGGIQLPAGISLLMWNGSWTSKTVMCGDGGVFDISVYKSSGGTLAKFADLTAALDGGNNIPASARKGGMSVKYVQTSDNNYVKFFCMAQNFTTDVTQWAIADEGAYVENPEFIYVKLDADSRILWAIKVDGSIYYGAGVPQQIIDYIEEKLGDFSPNEYGDIVVFLNDLEKGDKTLQNLLNEKVDKEDGKSLIDGEFASGISYVENPEWLKVIIDNEDRILCGIKADGTFYFGRVSPQIEELIKEMSNEILNQVVTINQLEEEKTRLYTQLQGFFIEEHQTQHYGSYDIEFSVKAGVPFYLKIETENPNSKNVSISVIDSNGETFYQRYDTLNYLHTYKLDRDVSGIHIWAGSGILVDGEDMTITVSSKGLLNIQDNADIYEEIKPVFKCSEIVHYVNNATVPTNLSGGTLETFDKVVDAIEGTRGTHFESLAYMLKHKYNKDGAFIIGNGRIKLIAKHFLKDNDGRPTANYDETITTEFESSIVDVLTKWNGETILTYNGEEFTYKINTFELGNELDSVNFRKICYFGLSTYNDGESCSLTDMVDDSGNPLYYYNEVAIQQTYVAYCLAYKIIKKHRPDCIVLMNSTTNLCFSGGTYLKNQLDFDFLDNGELHKGAEYFDAHCSHYYISQDKALGSKPEGIIQRLYEYKNIINRNNFLTDKGYISNFPIYITEWGVLNHTSLTQEEGETEEEFNIRKEAKDELQAQYIPCENIMGLALGVEVMSYWILLPYSSTPTGMMLMKSDGNTEELPSYYAFNFLHTLIQEGSKRPKLYKRNSVYKAEWTNVKGQLVKMFWSTEDNPTGLKVIGNGNDLIYDKFGNELIIENTYLLTHSPIYVIDSPMFDLI